MSPLKLFNYFISNLYCFVKYQMCSSFQIPFYTCMLNSVWLYFAFSEVYSYQINVCLTWEVVNGNINLKCKVSSLKFRIYFVNPAHEEEGHCLPPIPHPTCYSNNIRNTISQDVTTNTTLLIIKSHTDISPNGPWSCLHGTHRGKAVTNVTGKICLICFIS